MPHNVGKYQQGGMKTQADMGYEHGGSGTPSVEMPPPAPPKNKLPVRENGKTVGNNDGHKAH